MRTLRETTEQQIAAELEAVRRAREAAINAMSEVCIDDPTFSLAHTSQTLPPMSLKRKRDDSEVEDVSGPASSAIAIVPVHSPKRARVASVVIQTTATVALGAVAAWSALAFS